MHIQNAIDIAVQERMIRHDETKGERGNPDFYQIAVELTHLDELSDRGWWANWGGCMYAETVIRAFGGVVADAALACNRATKGPARPRLLLCSAAWTATLNGRGLGHPAKMRWLER